MGFFLSDKTTIMLETCPPNSQHRFHWVACLALNAVLVRHEVNLQNQFLLASLTKEDGQEQLAMLSALGRDFVFTATHLRQLCNCKSMVGTVVARLLPTLVGGKFSLNMAIRKVDNMSEFIKMLTLCKEYLLFNPESPTGAWVVNVW